MHLRQRLLINLTAVFSKNAAQDIGSQLGYSPMLVADDVGKALKEGDRRIGIEQPAFKLAPVTAMQILSDKETTFHYMLKIQRKRLHYVA